MIRDATQSAVEGIAAGGEATGRFFDTILDDYNAAKSAFDLGLLLGVPPEVLESLGNSLNEAETLLNEGTRALQEALLSGMLDESTLQALAEAGGEWFQQIYDSLFGPGALQQLEDGWNDISDASLAALAELIPQMADGGASMIGSLVDAVSDGALSYEEALSLLSEATGEQVSAMIAQLEQLEAQLT